MMNKSYFYKRKKLVKIATKKMPTSIDDTGTGWIYTDISGMVKPELQKVNGKWQIVETATLQEIQAYNQAKQQEQFDQFMQKKLFEGQKYFNDKSKQITMQLFGRPQLEVNPIVIEIDESVTPILDKVRTGDWYSAMIMTTPQPTIAEVQNILKEVKKYVSKYVKNYYK